MKNGSMGTERFEINAAAMGQHDLMRNRKSQTRSIRLRAFEQPEHLDVARNSRTGVGYRDSNFPPGRGMRADDNLAGTFADRLDRVLDQIVQDATELFFVGAYCEMAISDVAGEVNSTSKRDLFPQGQNSGQKLGQVDTAQLQPLLAREVHEFANQRLQAAQFRHH